MCVCVYVCVCVCLALTSVARFFQLNEQLTFGIATRDRSLDELQVNSDFRLARRVQVGSDEAWSAGLREARAGDVVPALERGYSLVFNRLNERSRTVAALCNALADFFAGNASLMCGANV